MVVGHSLDVATGDSWADGILKPAEQNGTQPACVCSVRLSALVGLRPG